MAPLVIAAQPHQTEAKPSTVSQAMTPTAIKSPTDSQHIEADDDSSVAEFDPVREVIRAQAHVDRTSDHRCEQDTRNNHSQRS
jgi:hypothetical protein